MISFVMRALVVQAALLVATSSAFAQQKFGVELEYGAQRERDSQTSIRNEIGLLSIVKANFGGGRLAVFPWTKYQHESQMQAVGMLDNEGREWQVVPEMLDYASEGYELVSPPLMIERDLEPLSKVVAAIDRRGKMLPSSYSSTHFTFDVSHLTQNLDDVSELVDLILFIENNQIGIFNAVGPERYGQHINMFTVPLGLNQPELMHELAELPRDQRSFKNVRGIFKKYEARELELTGGKPTFAWKYRAANYGKLFGFGLNSELHVIEFRIPDLVNEVSVQKNAILFSRVITVGASVRETRFIDPFGPKVRFSIDDVGGKAHVAADRMIEQLPAKSYDLFIRELGLDVKQYTQKYGTDRRSCNAVMNSQR